jgi:hypothetical protein
MSDSKTPWAVVASHREYYITVRTGKGARWDSGRWPQERVAVLKGDAMMIRSTLPNMSLSTLWRGTSHVIGPGYPLLQRSRVTHPAEFLRFVMRHTL